MEHEARQITMRLFRDQRSLLKGFQLAKNIGVMDSRTKFTALAVKFREEGFSDMDIAGFQIPIGTAIFAETPAEIAISVAGELIRTRAFREGREEELPARVEELHHAKEEGIIFDLFHDSGTGSEQKKMHHRR